VKVSEVQQWYYSHWDMMRPRWKTCSIHAVVKECKNNVIVCYIMQIDGRAQKCGQCNLGKTTVSVLCDAQLVLN